MVIPIVVGVLGTVPKGSEKGLEEFEIGGWDQDHPDFNISFRLQ